MNPSFIHLRVHTEYSLSDGLVRIEELVEQATLLNMPAVAITDKTNLFAAVKFYQTAISAGIKPILGADIEIENAQNAKQPTRLTLLCQNQIGYKNLTKIISKAYIEGQATAVPIIQRAWLTNETTHGLIALSGAQSGDIGQTLLAGKEANACRLLEEWLQIFSDRFYLELQRTGRRQEEEYIQAALQLAHIYAVPVVATNGVRFITSDDYEAHEARVCIHSGTILDDQRRPRIYSQEQYLRTPAEMQTLFADIPESLINTVEIAKRCNVELHLGKSYLPHFPIPHGLTAEAYLAQQAEEGLAKRLIFLRKVADAQIPYHERLQRELNVINSMGFAGYFLIVADFIHWSKTQNIPVGPGRGSGAGSLVAYALQITDLDPLQYDLLFERFLNPERVSMPDFDIDFCMEGRDRVIEYVTERYGRSAVSQIITFGTMAARAVVRDVGRVLGHPYGMMDKIAKLIPFELGITLDKALAQEEELRKRYEQEEDVKILIDLARKLEGLARNVGKHAAGVVIAPSCLMDFAPLYCEPDSTDLVTQFDLEDIQAVGLVKFDFLGLRTLTIIAWAVQVINQKKQKNDEPLLNIAQIPIDDPATFKLLKACATTAIFQLESRGMKELVKRLQPDCLEDVIALVALFRPGPLQSGMVEDFINRKHGRAKVEYLHPILEPILRPTYGIIVYQEQVMQIAQELAGYSLGSADLLRRAMGKKKTEEMAKHRAIFIEGAKAKGIDANIAKPIFDLMEKFADYGFNKSHSAAYALLSYQTAWLKAHYPAEFMSAVLSSDMDHTEKIVGLLDECRMMKLSVIPPNINQSHYTFTVSEDGAIIYGLGAIKGVGQAAIELVLAERQQYGVFKDLFDLCQRIDTRKVNRRVLEALIRSGSLDSFGMNRAALTASLDTALQTADQHSQATQDGQQDLFGLIADTPFISAPIVNDWSFEQRLQAEKEVLGFYLSGHPITRYQTELQYWATAPVTQLPMNKNQSVVIAGWVIALRKMFTKRGDPMAILTLEDNSGRLELAVFSETYTQYKDLLNNDKLLIVEGEVSVDEATGNAKVIARRLLTITQMREARAKYLLLKLKDEQIDLHTIEKMQRTFHSYMPGRLPIFIEYQAKTALAELSLGNKWQVQPADELLQSLREMLGEDRVVVCYSA
jgi:DNA polymerase-3 subunit alpha